MKILVGITVILCLMFTARAAGGELNKNGLKKQSDDDIRAVFLSTIPDYPGNVILFRPTNHSITASIMLNLAARARIIYGADGKPEQQTEIFALKPGEPREVVLDNLPADAACSYRLVDAASNSVIQTDYCSGSFHTSRLPESSFTFTIQADSHLDGYCLPELYKLTLSNAAACKPDFHIDLGDTFMTGKIPKSDDALKQYLAQRYFLGLIGRNSPVFLVSGNHDGEEASKTRACEKDGLAVWACETRKKYFPNPVPDSFYSGNNEKQPYAGDLQDYYSWTWGNTLFVVLSPYWYSRYTRGGKSPWNLTIGKRQYEWLAGTLRNSQAKFKFVFIHQLTGGLDESGRGGIEAVPFYEWGGHEKDGRNTFAFNRPGWEKPIHDLLAETGVNAVFHGHDHFFAYQKKDGIIYQLVPQPAHRNFKKHQAEEYGYLKGILLPNSGFVRVTVTTDTAYVAYIRSALPAMASRGISNGQEACSYSFSSRTTK